MQNVRPATVSQLPQYDDIIDVRSPAEYAEDHIPGAISAPVLDDEQRAHIGTLYKQVSPFAAKKEGAALIARNVARHLETLFLDKPKNWRPLIYCWRGGQRSGAMAHILGQVGWSVGKLDGGYKRYRTQVLAELDSLPPMLHFRVLCGATGCGKSRLLQALQLTGAQVLDLEALAQHRGSLLGNLPGEPQPSQKMFESRLWEALHRFDAQRPVYVEAESKKIGQLAVPAVLLGKMRAAPCLLLEAPMPSRIAALKEDYAHFLADPALLAKRLRALLPLHGHKVIEHWISLSENGAWDELVKELLVEHYDPAYQRSTTGNYRELAHAGNVALHELDTASLHAAALKLLNENDQNERQRSS